jgi:serine/threonine-protein kinase
MIIQASEWLGQAVGEGRFLIVRCLHDGSMSQIFLGDDQTTGSPVIVKVPKLQQVQLDADFRQRFLREAHSLKRLAHPNIVRILCSGEEKGTPFVVLRYLEGGTLGDRMYTGPGQTPVAHSMASLLDWLPTVAQTLDYIHGKGYVHRDIKPHNILFDGNNKPFLGDLGITRVLAATTGEGGALTRLGERPPGTPPYMAPEQICGETGGAWSDQFALGVIVFEWLTGRRPFSGITAEEVFDSQREPLTLMHHVRPEVPEGISAVVARALSRRPADRFPTCQEFVTELIAAQRSPTMPAPTTAKAAPVASNPNPSPMLTPADDDLGVSVLDDEPKGMPTPKAPAPPTLPTAPPLPEPIREPASVRPESSRRSAWRETTEPVAAARTRPATNGAGRMLRGALVLVLLVVSCFAGSYFLPGTKMHQVVGQTLAPVLEYLKAPGWPFPPASPAPEDRPAPLPLRNDNKRRENQMEWLKSQLQEAQEALDQARRDTRTLQDRANRDLNEEKERRKEAVETVEQLKKDLDKLKKEIKKLRSGKDDISKTSEEISTKLAEAHREKAEIGRQRAEAKKQVDAVSRRALDAETQRDEARNAQKAAEEQKKDAEERAQSAEKKHKDASDKLSQIEKNMKQTKLWFVLKNSTDAPVSYKLRYLLWNGETMTGKPERIAKRASIKVSAPPGSIRVEVIYNANLGAGDREGHALGINAQSFRALAEPKIGNIDCKYTFESSRDRKKLSLVWN